MQPDPLGIREHEFHLAHRVGGARLLPEASLHATGRNRPPVDRHRINHPRVIGPVRQEFVAPVLEIGAALLENGRRKPSRGDVRRRVPVRIERDIADVGVHHRRLRDRIGSAGDDPHRVHDLSVLIHIEPRRGGVDDHVAAAPRRQRARPLQIEGEQLPLALAAVKPAGERRTQLAVNRIHPADVLHIAGKAWSSRRGAEQRHWRRRRRLELGIDINHAARVVLHIAGEGHEGLAEHDVGALRGAWLTALRRLDCSRHAFHIVAVGIEMVGLGGAEQHQQLLSGIPRFQREPQRRAAARAIEIGDRPRVRVGSRMRGRRDKREWNRGESSRREQGGGQRFGRNGHAVRFISGVRAPTLGGHLLLHAISARTEPRVKRLLFQPVVMRMKKSAGTCPALLFSNSTVVSSGG